MEKDKLITEAKEIYPYWEVNNIVKVQWMECLEGHVAIIENKHDHRTLKIARNKAK